MPEMRRRLARKAQGGCVVCLAFLSVGEYV